MKKRFKQLLNHLMYYPKDIQLDTLWLCNVLNRLEYNDNPGLVDVDLDEPYEVVKVLMGMMVPTDEEKDRYSILDGNVWLASHYNNTEEDNEFRLMVAQLMYLLVQDPENIEYALKYYKSNIVSKYK